MSHGRTPRFDDRGSGSRRDNDGRNYGGGSRDNWSDRNSNFGNGRDNRSDRNSNYGNGRDYDGWSDRKPEVGSYRSSREGSLISGISDVEKKPKKNRSAEFWVPKPEVPCPPPPIVKGYALPGFKAMPSTGINNEDGVYECFVCDSPCSTEEMLNAHLGGKNHIRKLDKAGWNSFLPPEPLGPIAKIEEIKQKKWKTGEKKTFTEVFPTNKGQFNCDTCNLEFDSKCVYETHMKGNPHKKRLKLLDEIAENGGKADCHLCAFIASSATQLEIHKAGKKHKQRVEQAKMGLPGGTPLLKYKTDPDAPKVPSKEPLRKKPWKEGE